MLARRLITTSVAAGAAVVLAAGPAAAHFCYNTKLTPEAMQGMANSQAFASFGDLAAEITGLCPAGVQVLADAAQVSLDQPIHLKAVMAGGTLKKADGGGTPAISHLDFEAIDAAFPDAIAACGG
jgi:hypothetical protein